MVESDDFADPLYQIPVYSLYGKSREPTAEMMEKVGRDYRRSPRHRQYAHLYLHVYDGQLHASGKHAGTRRK